MNRFALALALLFASLKGAEAQTGVRYTVHLTDPEHHLLRVTVTIPPGRATHEIQFPVWNALYQIRDFSQYMNWIRAKDASGHALPLVQLNPSRWRLNNAAAGATIEYEMFSNDPGPFGAELNLHHAFVNMAEILIYAEDLRHAPQQVEFTNVPAGWKIATPLANSRTIYSASSYDQLVDSPVEISDFTEQHFAGSCGTYRVVVDSANASQILEKILPPLQRIVNEASRWMNDCPFKTYTFIYHFSDSSGGGMEHAYSTAITLRPKDVEGPLNRFDLVSAHEFFHLWDVKRIRPQSLEPVDYTKENYTRALWFSEGMDTTAADSILLRAGLLDEQQFLAALSNEITDLQNSPARKTESVEQSSLDAWLERYPYYGLPDRSISYYTKGDLVGVLLDLRMREATNGRASIQTLFRWMNEHYAKQGKFFADSAGVQDAVEKITGSNFHPFFAEYVSGTREIPWDDFFAYVGLRLQSREEVTVDDGFDVTQNFDQSPVVARVEPGSTAERAGLAPGDVLMQVNGSQVGHDFGKDMHAVGVGGMLHLTVSRKGTQRELQFTLGESRQTVFYYEDVPGITAEQKQHRHEWLFGEDASSTQPKASSEPARHASHTSSQQLHAFTSPDGQMTRSSDSQ